ncbi:DMT family transporter [[Flexibacter] sp. ATCC 35208]|uniref:DMT family transporter n=1 Tax=[Flexibacter] sp. ATCC 35208 TaxID=1936242 RepID=UPI0009D5745D|nr:EamA family transporter [[Flexibacter] sp. ATCC 35208]OMP80620.1 EamA family transporter [[Flexibacter] sp. ATCC 35208]
MRQVVFGVLFAMLWASASVATKIGIRSAEPLILANFRFFLAGGGMLLFAYLIQKGKHRMPQGKEWRQLLTFGFLNTTLYLSLYVISMKSVSAGIGTLATATNPLFIMAISALWLKRPLRWYELTGMFLGLSGVAVATYPLLAESHGSVAGLIILLTGMLSVSVATVYYSRIEWELPNLVINGWQVFLGGLLLLPFTCLTSDFSTTRYDINFWGGLLWLVLPVSVTALQLFFYLVKRDAVRASLWLFLCPVFGFIYAAILLHEAVTLFTWGGTILVIAGLYLGQREKFAAKK